MLVNGNADETNTVGEEGFGGTVEAALAETVSLGILWKYLFVLFSISEPFDAPTTARGNTGAILAIIASWGLRLTSSSRGNARMPRSTLALGWCHL